MSADTINPTAAVVSQKPVRIKHAVALGIIDTTKAGVRIVSSTADVVEAIAVRVKLHNVATAADIIDELGNDKVTAAQELISKL